MTRILFISRCPPWPLYLGDRLILYHLGRELSLRRHQLDLLAFADRPDDWHEQHHYDMDFGHVELFPDPKRSPFSYLRRVMLPAARWPARAQQSWSPEMWRAVGRRLAAQPYDVVHLFGGIQVYEFRRALGDLAAVITPYESYSLYLRRTIQAGRAGEGLGSVPATARLLLSRRFESFMFAPYDRTVVVSPGDQDELATINPALRIEVIPNGVDTYEFRPRPVKRAAALLFVGNYEYPPNVDAALRLATDIFPVVKARVPGLRLWLVGNAPPPELRALASESIRVTGRVPDVRPYLARAAAFVSPLRLGAGIKNKVLEALAMGCPVIATPLSVEGIAVTDGFDALVTDGPALADAAVRLLHDPDLGRALSANGRRLIETHYSWNHVAERYEALYQAVIRPRPADSLAGRL